MGNGEWGMGNGEFVICYLRCPERSRRVICYLLFVICGALSVVEGLFVIFDRLSMPDARCPMPDAQFPIPMTNDFFNLPSSA